MQPVMAHQSIWIDALKASVQINLTELTIQGGNVHESDLNADNFRLRTEAELQSVCCFTCCEI
jgi:hypothetical protein